MTHSTLAQPARAIMPVEGFAPLTEEEMLRIGGGFAAVGSAIAGGCLIAGAVVAVCLIGVAIGVAAYLLTH